MEGWIKISRRITEHWLWNDAERLRWWIDLLCLAAWEDRRVMHDGRIIELKRGSLIASVASLSGRWGRSNHTIIKFLKLLEEENMILREILHRQTPMITICNYDRYQIQNDVGVHTQMQTIVHTKLHTNKEIKKYNNNNNNNNAHASVREKNALKKEYAWIEVIAMQHKLEQQDVLAKIDEFYVAQECLGNEEGHESLSEAKRHFCLWLMKQTQIKQQQTNSKEDAKRRGYYRTSAEGDDYTTNF